MKKKKRKKKAKNIAQKNKDPLEKQQRIAQLPSLWIQFPQFYQLNPSNLDENLIGHPSLSWNAKKNERERK